MMSEWRPTFKRAERAVHASASAAGGLESGIPSIFTARMRFLLLLAIAAPLVAQQPLTAFDQQKARDLLHQLLPCLGCHELDGDGGRSAPSLTTVHERRSAAYIRAIIEEPQRIVPGAAMPRIPMPSSTREAVIRYLARAAPVGSQPALSSQIVPGENFSATELYNRWCVQCHGRTGAGDGPNAAFLPVPPTAHRDARTMRSRSDDALFDVIAAGGLSMGKSARMPAFGETLTLTEIRSLVAYIRTLCACSGPAWSRDAAR